MELNCQLWIKKCNHKRYDRFKEAYLSDIYLEDAVAYWLKELPMEYIPNKIGYDDAFHCIALMLQKNIISLFNDEGSSATLSEYNWDEFNEHIATQDDEKNVEFEQWLLCLDVLQAFFDWFKKETAGEFTFEFQFPAHMHEARMSMEEEERKMMKKSWSSFNNGKK